MSAGLPKHIDVKRFAETGRQLEGEISLEDCPRLSQAVDGAEGPFVVKLAFQRHASGYPVIVGEISGQVIQECQRCLKPAVIDLDSEVSLGMVATEADEASLPDDFDPLVAAEEVNLFEIIEDELLLALPIVPIHEQCDLPAANMTAVRQEEPERENPFAVLASLKTGQSSDDK